jgi:biotin operon repressor
MEARYTTARSHVEKLTPSLLAKAFRGELVEQDPTDEPASVLLERIRAQKESASTKKRSSLVSKHSHPDTTPANSISPLHPPPRPLPSRDGEKTAPIPLLTSPLEGEGITPAHAGSIPLALLKAMKPGHEYSRADLTAAIGITDTDWTWAIRQLRESGQVIQIGERRGARYRRNG